MYIYMCAYIYTCIYICVSAYIYIHVHEIFFINMCKCICGSRVKFLLKTDSGYPKDAGVFFHSRWKTLGVPFALIPIGQLHQSSPSPIPGDLG